MRQLEALGETTSSGFWDLVNVAFPALCEALLAQSDKEDAKCTEILQTLQELLGLATVGGLAGAGNEFSDFNLPAGTWSGGCVPSVFLTHITQAQVIALALNPKLNLETRKLATEVTQQRKIVLTIQLTIIFCSPFRFCCGLFGSLSWKTPQRSHLFLRKRFLRSEPQELRRFFSLQFFFCFFSSSFPKPLASDYNSTTP